MDVYLDAVFHPAIYHRPEIFRQEGWRYEGDKDGLCYQGVVLNEMKGTFSNPESILRNTEKNCCSRIPVTALCPGAIRIASRI